MHRTSARTLLVTAALAATAGLAIAAPSSASAETDQASETTRTTYDTGSGYGPKQWGFIAATAYSSIFPNRQPQGVNDWSCEAKSGEQPVVLVHGTYANQYNSFARMAPELKAKGYCLYAFNYGMEDDSIVSKAPGVYGTPSLSSNAGELVEFTDEVLERTGAEEVDMIGWSQGGTLINDYLKREGGDHVDDAITYGATHHGTTLSGIALLAGFVDLDRLATGIGQAGVDQIQGSAYYEQLNANGDTVPGVDYTVVATKYDEVTTPYRSTFLEAGDGATVKNVTLQTGCAIDTSDHLSIMYSPRAIDLAKKALNDDSGYLRCTPNLPIL